MKIFDIDYIKQNMINGIIDDFKTRRDATEYVKYIYEDKTKINFAMFDIKGMRNFNKVSYSLGDCIVALFGFSLEAGFLMIKDKAKVFRYGGDEFIVISRDKIKLPGYFVEIMEHNNIEYNFTIGDFYPHNISAANILRKVVDEMYKDMYNK